MSLALIFSILTIQAQDDREFLENDFDISTGISVTENESGEAQAALNIGMYRRGIIVKNLSEKQIKRILEIALEVDINSNADISYLNIKIIPLALDRIKEGQVKREWNKPNGSRDSLIFFPIEISKNTAMNIEREISVYAFGFQRGSNHQILKDAPKAQWIYTDLDARIAGVKNFDISSYHGGENLTGFSMFELKAELGYGRQLSDKVSIRFVVGGSYSFHWIEKVMNGVENASLGIKDTHAFAKIEVGTDTDIFSIEGRYHHVKSFAKDDDLYTNYEDIGINENNLSLWIKYKKKW